MANLSDEKSGEKAEELVEPSKATRLFIVWRKLKSSKLAVAGFGIIVFMVMLALLASVIAPYDLDWRGIASVLQAWSICSVRIPWAETCLLWFCMELESLYMLGSPLSLWRC